MTEGERGATRAAAGLEARRAAKERGAKRKSRTVRGGLQDFEATAHRRSWFDGVQSLGLASERGSGVQSGASVGLWQLGRNSKTAKGKDFVLFVFL